MTCHSWITHRAWLPSTTRGACPGRKEGNAVGSNGTIMLLNYQLLFLSLRVTVTTLLLCLSLRTLQGCRGQAVR